MTVEIVNLQQVILYEFQRTRKKEMTFGELTVVCSKAAPNLPRFYYEDSLAGRKFFIKEIVRHLRQLSDVYGLIAIDWIVNGKKIDRVAITPKGSQMLCEMQFTLTGRMETHRPTNLRRSHAPLELPFAR